MPDLHHLLPLLKITPTRTLGNDETPRRASERTVEDVLEQYRIFSRRRIPADRESAEYFRFDEDLSIMLYRLRQFISRLHCLVDRLVLGVQDARTRRIRQLDARRPEGRVGGEERGVRRCYGALRSRDQVWPVT